ncbi:hypothetical protein MWH28_10885 [Natroniella sulfidigena]|uniref:hypothetical protein n=1 Tax=Natroniella sulfidigena TaxID=723921 RepID=UPI00200ADB98|nr:hypothetical protein [Natroniella sulfidigena]MCK8817868.1 hypothetical protein [Natroniella sulfidigena]
MKKLLIIIMLLTAILTSTIVGAEEDVKSVELEEERVEKITSQFSDSGGFRIGGGPQLGVVGLDLSDLNEIIDNDFGQFDDYIVLIGGGGSIGIRNGSRFGGFGMHGRTSTSKKDETGTTNEAILELNYGGFVYERGVWVGEKFDLAVGALLGGGNLRLDLLHDSVEGFEDIVDKTAEGSSNTATLEKKFALLEPRLNLRYQFGAFTGVDLGVGYILTHDFGDNWEIADSAVRGGPMSNTHGPTATLRLSFGF